MANADFVPWARTAVSESRFNENKGPMMFEAIWTMVVWMDGTLEANALPAVVAFISSAMITSALKLLFSML
jgi:hypothetical protein